MPEMIISILQTLPFIHIVFFIIIQLSLDLASGAPQGSVFPGKFTWGYLRDIIGPGNQLQNPEYFNSLGNPNGYVDDSSSFLFLRNPNSLDDTPNRDTDANRFSSNLIFDDFRDRFSGQFPSNTAKKPLFTFSDRPSDRNSVSGSSTRDNGDVDRVISDIIRVVPSRDRDNKFSETSNKSPNFANDRPRSNLDNTQDNNDGGWTALKPSKPRIIGATRQVYPTSREETSTVGQPDNMMNRFNLLKTNKPLFNFNNHIREHSLDDGVKKSGANREDQPRGRRVPGPPHPLNSIYKKGSGNIVSSSITTILTGMMAVLMLYPLLILQI